MTATVGGAPLSALEEERDFLLRSLDDLEREHDAGDVDDTDYVALRDDYTARAAAVIRRLAAGSVTPAPTTRGGSRLRRLGAFAGVLLFAVLAGLLVAHMSGSRRDGATASGSVRDNTRQLIADATTASGRRQYDDAIGLYGKALDLSPANAEALTYRGWARYLKGGDAAGAIADVESAIAVDASYPDARVFHAIMLVGAGRFTDADSELKVFDSLNPPSMMVNIVRDNSLRERIVAGLLLADGAPTYTAAGYTRDQVFALAQTMAEVAKVPSDAVRLVDLLLVVNPADGQAHAYKGWILARTGVQANDAAVAAAGLSEIDAALALEPQRPEALVYRAFTLFYGSNDAAGAKAALAAFDALPDKPAELVTLIDGQGLRDAITAALQK
jgi:tetratricopeptide (TPR) repeat protein